MAHEYHIDALFGAHLDAAVIATLGKPWRIEVFCVRYPHPERHMTARVVNEHGRVINFNHDNRFHRDWLHAGYLMETGKISISWPQDPVKGRPCAWGTPESETRSFGRTMPEAITRAYLKQHTKSPFVELEQKLELYIPYQDDLLAQLAGVTEVKKDY